MCSLSKVKRLISLLVRLRMTICVAALGLCACSQSVARTILPQAVYPVRIGVYEIFDPRALSVLDVDADIVTLATGFEWLEGPVWSQQHDFLLFSDIPTHKVYKYQQGKGVTEYLADSGFSNGLLIRKSVDQHEQLLLMQSRSRQVAVMHAPITAPAAQYQVLARQYNGQRLNSPNDVAMAESGTVYFTDPPYGLPKQLDDPAKELDFQGVYALRPGGELILLDKTLTFPNGIALHGDQKTLYVAASNPQNPAWYRYELNDEGEVQSRHLFYQTSVEYNPSHGLPDGLKVHTSGLIFATGPQGIWLFGQQGKLLAKVYLPSIAANLAFNGDQSQVFVTAHNQLLSFPLKQTHN